MLTDAALDKICLIVKEEIKMEIASSEARIKEHIDIKIEGVDKQFEGVNKQIAFLMEVVYGLIALIVAAIAIPKLTMAK